MRTFKKKSVAIVAAGAVVLGSAGAAYAYWTAGGAGVGEGTTGTNVALVANQTSVIEDMGPGIAAQDVSGNFDNANDTLSYVATVTVTIDSITQDPGAVGTCDATDYLITNGESTVNADIPVGTGVGAWGVTDTPTLEFVNKAGVNQDGCKLATVNLAFAIA